MVVGRNEFELIGYGFNSTVIIKQVSNVLTENFVGIAGIRALYYLA